MKISMFDAEKLQEKVIDYLSKKSEFCTENALCVLQKLYNEVVGVQSNEKLIETLTNDLKELESKESLSTIEQKVLEQTKEELKKAIEGSYIEVPVSFVNLFFTKSAEEEATFRKINRELSEMVKTERTIFDDTAINNALATIGDCYGISDEDLKPILALFSQVKHRINAFRDAGDIRKISSYNDFGIMPAFHGEQGCGKSEFASIIARTMGSECEYCIDDIIGDFGTLDVFYKPLIIMNEFGRQKKEGLDLLKSYINGEKVTVNKKFREPVVGRVFSSFILTSNPDPEMLKGTDLGSRRICVVEFTNKIPTKSIDEIERAVKTIWEHCDETTFQRFFNVSKENLSRGNLEKQTESAINDFLSTISEDDKLWLNEEWRTITAIHHYFNEQHYSWSKTFIQNICNYGNIFKVENGVNKRRKLDSKYL